jgi:hypothetical protein
MLRLESPKTASVFSRPTAPNSFILCTSKPQTTLTDDELGLVAGGLLRIIEPTTNDCWLDVYDWRIGFFPSK